MKLSVTQQPPYHNLICLISTLIIIQHLTVGVISIGVNYGTVANNLPAAPQVAEFLKNKTIIDRVKIFDLNPDIIRAFSGTGILLSITIPNGDIPSLANPRTARRWVTTNIKPFYPLTKIHYILVGSEVLHWGDQNMVSNLVPAMRAINSALVKEGLSPAIKVTTAHSLGILLSPGIFPLNEKIENINNQYWTLRAEEIPEEEKNLGPHDRLIYVYHFMKVTAQNQVQVQNFGEPFVLLIHEGETLTEVKERIQKKLQVPDEEFSKWKFAFLTLGHLEYLQDLDVVSSHFQRRGIYGAWEQYLGLEHSDNTPKRSYVANQESGCQEESQHPSQDNNSGNVEVDTTAISGEEVSSVESVWQGLVLTEAPSVDKEAKRVHSESTLCTSFSGTSPPQQAAQPILGTQASSEATPVGATSTITQAGGHASRGQASDNAKGCNIGKVRFLSYWVSSEASLLLERIHGLHNDTFTKLSMKGHILQTMLLESFASFIESISNTKVHDEEALRLAAISIEDFEQVGLDLSWLKQRLDDAKRVNKHTKSLTFVDLCESALKVARAKVRELEESLVKAKAEVEVGSRDLPKSLGVDDSVLKDVV